MALSERDEKNIERIVDFKMKSFNEFKIRVTSFLFGEGADEGMVGKVKDQDKKINNIEIGTVELMKSNVRIEATLSLMKWIIGILVLSMLGLFYALIEKLFGG